MRSAGDVTPMDRLSALDSILGVRLSKESDRPGPARGVAEDRRKPSSLTVEIPVDELRQLASRSAGVRRRRGRRVEAVLIVSALAFLGVVLGWQSYGQAARDLAKNMTSLPRPSQAPAEPSAPVNTAEPRRHAAFESAVASESFAALSARLENVAADVATVQKLLEEIAAKQQELAAEHSHSARNTTALQAIEQEIKQLGSVQRTIVARLQKQARPPAPVRSTIDAPPERIVPPAPPVQAQMPAPPQRSTDPVVLRPPAPISEASKPQSSVR